MSFAPELAALFHRDLTRLLQELEAFPDSGDLWQTLPGIGNSVGNLTLHLEGNLREYIGRQLGGLVFTRKRDREFSDSGIPVVDLARRIGDVRQRIPPIVAGLSAHQLQAPFPEEVFGAPISTQQLLFSLYGHLSYHLGQIDYLRRIVTQGSAIRFAGL